MASRNARVNLRWSALEPGQSVTLNGLTLTAARYLSAQETASAWAHLGSSAGTPAASALGIYSGVWGSAWSTGAPEGAQLTVQAVNTSTHWDLRGTMSTSNGPVRENNVFVWQAGDAQVGAVDVIRDFVAWDATLPGDGPRGDRLDIRELLEGYSTNSDLSQWVRLLTGQTVHGTSNSSTLLIDVDGTGAGTLTQTIHLQGTNLTGSTLTTLLNNGVLIA